MKRFLSLAVVAVLAIALAVPAVAADLMLFRGNSDDGIGANPAQWPWEVKGDHIDFWREGADQILKDISLGTNVNASGYNYLLVDMMVSHSQWIQFVEHVWMVIASGDVDNNNLRLTAFGYAEHQAGGPISDHDSDGARAFKAMKANEWTTVWFPLYGSYAWDSNEDSFNAAAVDRLRFQAMNGGNDMLIPAGATVSIKNVRLSDSKTGGGTATTPPGNSGSTSSNAGDKESSRTGDSTLIFFAIGGLLVAAVSFTVLRKRVKA